MTPSPVPLLWPDKLFQIILEGMGWDACCINEWKFTLPHDGFAKGIKVDFFFRPPETVRPTKNSGFFKVIPNTDSTRWGLSGVRHALAAVRQIELVLPNSNFVPAARKLLLKACVYQDEDPGNTVFRYCDGLQNCKDTDGTCALVKRDFCSGNLETMPREIVLATLDSWRGAGPPLFSWLSQFHDPEIRAPGATRAIKYMSDLGTYTLKTIRLLLQDFEAGSSFQIQEYGRKPRKMGLSTGSNRVLKELISLAPYKSVRRWADKMKEDPRAIRNKRSPGDNFEKWLKGKKQHEEQLEKEKKKNSEKLGTKTEKTVDAVFKFFKKSKKPCASKDFRKAVLKAGKIMTQKGIAQAYEKLKKDAQTIAKKSAKRQIQSFKKSIKGRIKRAVFKKLGIPKIARKRFPSKKTLIKKVLKKTFRYFVKKSAA